MIYKYVYRCRLCGQTFESGSIDSGDPDKIFIKHADGLMRLTHHDCYGGDIGIADFQGWKKGE